MKIDLHIHTVASDGCWTPQKLLEEICGAHISAFAVTDHDSTDSIAPTAALAWEASLSFLPGVEISTTFHGALYHILGYGIDYLNQDLELFLAHNRRLMNQKDDDSIKLLIDQGYSINIEEYLQYQNDPVRGGWKALNFLVDAGLCRDAGDFFSSLFSGDFSVPFPIFPSPADVIAVIKKAGGIPILAHPGGNFGGDLNKSNHNLELTLEQFMEQGIEGLECYHPSHDRQVTEDCLQWCRRNRLFITGGSDCHGEFIARRKLGSPVLHLNNLNLGRLVESIGNTNHRS